MMILPKRKENGEGCKFIKRGISMEDLKHIFDDRYTFRIFDTKHNELYYEDSLGFWTSKEFDDRNNMIYQKNSNGYWEKSIYDDNHNIIYQENSKGYWASYEYDYDNVLILSLTSNYLEN